MHKLMCKRLCALLVITPLMLINTSLAEVIHSERSLYRNILVEDKGDVRCLKFNVKSSKTRQSCYYKSNPEKLLFNYTKQLLTALLINPEPQSILIIGLGGGTMSNTLHQLLPHSRIDNIEIDQSVIKVARQYFAFLENDKIKTYSQDGRVFVKRALLKKQKYDWIILDAFNGDYIPEHLMTQEFLLEVKMLLSDEGILTANTFSSSQLYPYESATYKAVFGDFYQVTNKDNSNRIILAKKHGFIDAFGEGASVMVHKENAAKLSEALLKVGVDANKLFQRIQSTKNKQNWPEDSPVLTDQFSPANLLNMSGD